MGLKCSVIGHTYGETEVEREREEQGSEVVITIQERETCERCGKTRIVSENKEVTAIETPSDIANDIIDDGEAAADDNVDTPEADVSSNGSADEEADADDGAPAADDGSGFGESAVDVNPDANDAEILDDDDDTPSGDSELEDPSTELSVDETAESEPPTEAEDDSVTTDPDEDDGMIIDGDDGTSDDDRAPGEWPDEPDSDGDDWTPKTGGSDDDGDEASGVEPFGGNAVTVPEGQFRCPECEFTTEVASSSLRAGDFCPECHMGALEHTAE